MKNWASGLATSSLFLSAISVLELETGVLQVERRDAKQGAMLRRWLDRHVLPAFASSVLAIDTAAGLRCARLHVPDKMAHGDALIAATALAHRLTVVTRNIADFEPAGVELINPLLAQG